ncbi:MAG: regulator of sigma protease [Solirubrobacterales bacterium]|nr:regulator of sigma protease [Solirubrobacterales bacterium]
MSWVLAFLGFAALVILHEAGHFTAAKAVGMRVERFFLFFPPKLWSIKRGETEYGIGAIPLGGFVKITGMNPEEPVSVDVPAAAGSQSPPEPKTVPATEYARSYSAAPVWKRIVVIAAGPFVNLVVAFVILYCLAFSVQEATNEVESVQPGSAAAAVLQPGDRLLAVDGVRADLPALRDRIASHTCAGDQTDGCRAETPAKLTLLRDGREVTVSARPVYDATAQRPLLGFTYGTTPLNPGALGAASWSLDRMWDVTSQTVGIVGRIFNAEERKQISGVVGGYEVTRQSFAFDTRQALFVLALISLSLAVINLFPFLPLDGGHIFWALVEKIRGRRVSLQTMERASVVGFALVLMLFAIGLSNDIGRLSGDGFNVR